MFVVTFVRHFSKRIWWTQYCLDNTKSELKSFSQLAISSSQFDYRSCCQMTRWRIDSKVAAPVCGTKKWTSLSFRFNSDNMNGIQTVDLLPGREAQQLSFKEDIQLPLTDVSVSACVCVWVWNLEGKNARLLESYHETVSQLNTGWSHVTKPVFWGGRGLLQCRRRPEIPRRGQWRWIRQQLRQPQWLDSSLQAPS